jgi:uncharacterized phage-associated protein
MGHILKSFDVEKFKQVLHYTIHKTGDTPNVGKTVLYKILYFIDFNYYELFEKKLTGETYLKSHYGPSPRDFGNVMSELKDERVIEEKEWTEGIYKRIKYLSTVEPVTSKIAKEELDFIDENIDKYSRFNATQISEHSHKDIPYIAAEDFEELDYELVFYRDTELSVRTYDDVDGGC